MTMTLSKRQSRALQEDRATADFEKLFQENWERLCGVLYRILGDWEEAEDIVLETFVQLYRRPPKEERNLSGWLYRVATRWGLNALRARRRRMRYEEQAGKLANQEMGMEDPAKAVERRQERQQVRSALANMPPRSAQILVLRHSGFSYSEIAQAIGISSASVGTLLARAEREFEKKYRLGVASRQDA